MRREIALRLFAFASGAYIRDPQSLHDQNQDDQANDHIVHFDCDPHDTLLNKQGCLCWCTIYNCNHFQMGAFTCNKCGFCGNPSPPPPPPHSAPPRPPVPSPPPPPPRPPPKPPKGSWAAPKGKKHCWIGPDCDRSTFRPSPPPPPPPPVRPPPLLVLPPRVPTLSPPPSPPDPPPRAPGVAFVARDTSQGGVPVALVALGGGGLALAAAFLCLATGICCPNASIAFNRRLRGLRQPAAAVSAEAKADPEPAAAPPPRAKPAKGRPKPPSKPKGKYGRIDTAQSSLD